MKKILAVFALFCAIFFLVSCGGGKSDSKTGSLYEKCYPNETCDKGLVCDTENNVCIKDPDHHGDENNGGKPVDNNDTDSTIENNDGNEQPIDNNDSDDVIDDNDTDDQPIDNDDTDDVIDDSDTNDNDSNENNDNDDNPSENDDSDNTNDSNVFFEEDMVAEKWQLENLTQAQIEDKKRERHDELKQQCPYNHIQQPEQYDEYGNMYIVDKCEGNLSEPMWLENAAPKILYDRYGVPPQESQRIVSMTVDYSNTGSQSNMKIRVPGLVLDVNFVSASCLSQVAEGVSIIEMTPSATKLTAGCRVDGENEALPIEAKSTKQTRTPLPKYSELCRSMPNYELDKSDNACYTTIEDFVWLENVTRKLLTRKSDGYWYGYPFSINSIKRDLDTNTFYMTMQIGEKSGSNNHMYVYVTLNNAKSCIDQCHGKEGCTSHIEPTQDASKGCFINGVEVNGEEL